MKTFYTKQKKNCRNPGNIVTFAGRELFFRPEGFFSKQNLRGFFFTGLVLFAFLLPLNAENFCEVYFTDPGPLKNQNTDDNPEKKLISKIRSAKHNICGAFFELSSRPVVSELIKAKERGIDVRLVLERDNFVKNKCNTLQESGIPIVTDERNGFMHNKFAVFDRELVWTGSYNLTHNGAYKNNNNAVCFYSPEAAAIYLSEFDEMFKEKIFGNKKELIALPFFKKNNATINNKIIEIYFSPEDDIEDIIIQKLRNAVKSVHFMVFSFTSSKISNKLIELHKSGVEVNGLIEKTGSNSKYSEYKLLKLEGINVVLDKNKYRMHHKVIVIDREILITGSYNFSKNANKINDENVLIITDKSISDFFVDEFYRLTE